MNPSPRLAASVEAFFEELRATVNAVLIGEHELELRQSGERFVLQPVAQGTAPDEIPWIGLYLRDRDARVGRLNFRYEFTMDHQDQFLKVVSSQFELIAETDRSARLRLDYVPQVAGGKSAPIAHWQVHAHHNAFAHWLTLIGGKQNKKRQGRLERIHLPVGGERYRPCLEDVLQLLKTDFGVATKPGAQAAIDAGRTRWREIQLRTAVRDHPELAADALRACGYEVGSADPGETRSDRFRQY